MLARPLPLHKPDQPLDFAGRKPLFQRHILIHSSLLNLSLRRLSKKMSTQKKTNVEPIKMTKL